MKIKQMYYVLSLLIAFSLILAACAPQVAATTQAPSVQTEEPAMTEAPTDAATEAPTEEPTAEPTTRRGGWLDEIVVSVVADDSAISQIQAGTIDFYSFNLASDVFPAIQDAGLPATQSFGGYYGISLNPTVLSDTSRLI